MRIVLKKSLRDQWDILRGEFGEIVVAEQFHFPGMIAGQPAEMGITTTSVTRDYRPWHSGAAIAIITGATSKYARSTLDLRSTYCRANPAGIAAEPPFGAAGPLRHFMARTLQPLLRKTIAPQRDCDSPPAFLLLA